MRLTSTTGIPSTRQLLAAVVLLVWFSQQPAAARPDKSVSPQWWTATSVEAELTKLEPVLKEFGIKDPLRWARNRVSQQKNWTSPQAQAIWDKRIHYWRIVLLDDDPESWSDWLNMDHPSLADRKQQFEAGGAQARRAWAAHIADKPKLSEHIRDDAVRTALFEVEGRGAYSPDGTHLPARAEGLLRGQVQMLDVPPTVGEGDYGWVHNSSGCWHLLHLALAYYHTNDAKWVHEFQNQVVALVAGHQMDQNFTGVATRVRYISATYWVMKDSPAMSDRFHGICTRMILADADHLHELDERAYGGNYDPQTGLALYTTATMFPEFKLSRALLDRMWRNLLDGYRTELLDDGCHYHRSLSYHLTFVQRALSMLAIARTLGLSDEVPEEFKELTGGAVDAFARVSTPIRSTPGINDDWTVGHDHHNTLRLAADLFDREDLRYLATDGREGTLPKESSLLLPAAQLMVMRSDWSKSARWLFFNVSPFGGHHHCDDLSIQIWSGGRKLLVEPYTGDYLFERNIYRRSWWHSTPTLGPSSLPDSPNPRVLHWESSDKLDYAVGQITVPVGARRPPAKFRRHIFFVDRDYWVLRDEFAQVPAGTAIWENFHFATRQIDTSADGRSVRTMLPSSPNLLMLVGQTGWELQQEETRLWPSYTRDAMPTATLHYQGDATAAEGGFSALFVPLKDRAVPEETSLDRVERLDDGRVRLYVTVAGNRRELTTRAF